MCVSPAHLGPSRTWLAKWIGLTHPALKMQAEHSDPSHVAFGPQAVPLFMSKITFKINNTFSCKIRKYIKWLHHIWYRSTKGYNFKHCTSDFLLSSIPMYPLNIILNILHNNYKCKLPYIQGSFKRYAKIMHQITCDQHCHHNIVSHIHLNHILIIVGGSFSRQWNCPLEEELDKTK